MRRSGEGKAEVESATGSTIGVYDANFEVYEGEIFVVIGLSGSGKSTLLRLINRLIEPTEGKVFLGGRYISEMSSKQLREVRRSKMGMVFQHFGLFPNRTVLENIVFGLEVKGVPSRERRQAGEQTLDMVGLQGQAQKRITELSGGMQQRVGLARALATGQEILLMDEPFSALDPLIRRDMQNLFLDIQGEIQRTVIFITHDLDEALRLGHRVAIMNDGEIVQVGTPEEILRHPADEYVKRFVEDVDYSKVRAVESIMSRPEVVASPGEEPGVVLRRMRAAHLESILVTEEGRLVGAAGAEAVSGLAERGAAELRAAVDTAVPSVNRRTSLRETLPHLTDSRASVAVVDEENRLEGVVLRDALITGLYPTSEARDKSSGQSRVESASVAADREGVR